MYSGSLMVSDIALLAAAWLLSSKTSARRCTISPGLCSGLSVSMWIVLRSLVSRSALMVDWARALTTPGLSESILCDLVPNLVIVPTTVRVAPCPGLALMRKLKLASPDAPVVAVRTTVRSASLLSVASVAESVAESWASRTSVACKRTPRCGARVMGLLAYTFTLSGFPETSCSGRVIRNARRFSAIAPTARTPCAVGAPFASIL